MRCLKSLRIIYGSKLETFQRGLRLEIYTYRDYRLMQQIRISPWRAYSNWSCDRILGEWDCPYDFEELKYSLIHFGDTKMFYIEDPQKLLKRTDSKKNAHVVRILLAYLYLFSDNPEMWSWLRDTSPVRGHLITEEEWEEVEHIYKQVKLRESFPLTSALVPASL